MRSFLFTCTLCLIGYLGAFAQSDVQQLDMDGTTYFYSTDMSKVPDEILGLYQYKNNGQYEEPIVELTNTGKGQFQPHGVPAIPINFWIEVNEKGEVQKVEGVNGNYQVVLVIQYTGGTNGNYPAGGYSRMAVTVAKDMNQAIIYGERFKPLN